MVDKDALAEIYKAMDYKDGTECCGTCAFHRGADMSGGPSDKPERCEINAFWIPVKSGGHCMHWEETQK